MASTTLNFPPLDYSLLLPDLINFHMEKNPTFPAYVYPNDNVPGGLTEVSFLEFGRAAHRIAHALRPSRQGSDGEVVLILANADTLLHHAVLVGLSVAGWVPFPASPRNSAAAVAHLMSKTNCSRIVTIDHAHKSLIDDVRHEIKGAELTVFEFPALHYAFPKLGHDDPFVPYPAPLKRPDLDSPAIYIHSSGSTGFPKPIRHSHKIQIQWLARPSLRVYKNYKAPRRNAAMALPAFHTFGIVTQLYAPIAHLVTATVYAPRAEHDPHAQPVIPTSDNMIEHLKKVQSNVLMTVPTLLEQIASSEEGVEVLRKLDFVCFGGGPLPVKVGDRLWAAGVHLVSGYGGTEFGILNATPNDEALKDTSSGTWQWMSFEDDPKIRWAPQGDDSYELQILSTETQYMAVENLTDVKGYTTSDVFVKHPTKDLWRIVGRADDVIILESGEKTVPAPIESVIGSSPLVQGIVMFGRERNQVGVLIEPRPEHAIDVKDEKAVAEFRNRIWPAVEEANKPSPAFSRIFKEMILITSSDKPMKRTPKGSVQRKLVLKDYDAEINALYETVEASTEAPDGPAGPSAWTSDVLEGWLLEHARIISNGAVDPSTDLFAQGFDSLSVTYLRNRILGALRKSSDPDVKKAASHIPQNVIFDNPTIELLGARIAAIVSDDGAGQAHDFVEQHKRAINAMIEKYSVGLDGPTDGVLPSSASIEPAVVLLTGSTGGLGSFLLAELIKNPAVQRVYAYNRPSSSKSIVERQKSAFKDRGLEVDLLSSSKLVYVEADAALEKCGLSATQYEEIRDSVTLIIHNAWRLDFNLAISSFEDSIRASRNLIDLGLDSRHKQNHRFLFTSSIGSAQSWDNAKGPFPEEVQLEPSVTSVGAGYGESKYATERIIVKSGLHATSFRIGQIAGGHNGSWATTDWFPIIVKSSVALGVLPEAAGVVSWLREEEVAAAILEAGFAKDAPPPALNIVNPSGVAWAEIIAHVRRSIIRRKALRDEEHVLRIVPFEEWFALLGKKAENASEDDLAKIPAIKLLEFFRNLARGDQAIRSRGVVETEAAGMTNFSTSKVRGVSPTMANMRAIGEVEADAWVGYWISKGAF